MLFSKTLLRKLYGGSFIGDSKIFLEFFADQIMVVRRKKSYINSRIIKKNMFSPKKDPLKRKLKRLAHWQFRKFIIIFNYWDMLIV